VRVRKWFFLRKWFLLKRIKTGFAKMCTLYSLNCEVPELGLAPFCPTLLVELPI
jgi:hypothetical protein